MSEVLKNRDAILKSLDAGLQFRKSTIKFKKLLIFVLALQNLLFAYGAYCVLTGSVYVGWFHVVLNGIFATLNWRAIRKMNKSLKLVEEMEMQKEEMDQQLIRIGLMAIELDEKKELRDRLRGEVNKLKQTKTDNDE